MQWKTQISGCKLNQERIQRFWKGRTLYVGHHGWLTKKSLGFRWSKKARITLETLSFWQNISITIFQFFFIFINNESLSTKSDQFQYSMRKEKLTETGICFITGCIKKSFKMIIIFFIHKLTCSAVFDLLSEWCNEYQ